MQIALTNLGKYNEGELIFTWLTIPFTDEELDEAKKKIGINEEYEEWFISDYEAPFQIQEYENLGHLNRVAEVLDGLTIPDGYLEVEDVLSFASALEDTGYISDAGYHVGDIISDERANEIMKARVEEGRDWTAIRIFLNDADGSANWHYLDGYDNLGRITQDYLEGIVADLMKELFENLV